MRGRNESNFKISISSLGILANTVVKSPMCIYVGYQGLLEYLDCYRLLSFWNIQDY